MQKILLFILGGVIVVLALITLLNRTHTTKTPSAEVIITSTPTIESSEKNIVVTTPQNNDTLTNKLIIKGQARVFENIINFRLKDNSGKILSEGNTYVNSPDVGQFGPFEVDMAYNKPTTDFGTLEVFWHSPKDGEEIDKTILYLKFPKEL